MTRELARLADLAEKDPPAALARLREMKAQARAKSRRVSAKKAPGRKAKASAKAQRAERTAQVRAAVFARDGGRCICGAEATDLHHCLSGPDRMAREHERTCIAVCRHCHRRLHDGVLLDLYAARERCHGLGLLNAYAAIDRRIDKITRVRLG